MPRSANKLSALKIKNLNTPGYYGDGLGLWLQVSKFGTKSWVFRFERDKKRHEMGLGPLNTISLAEARTRAAELRKLLVDGIDPLFKRREQQTAARLERARAMTFQEAADEYIRVHSSGWRNPKHADQWRNTIRDYCSPIFGSVPVQQVDTELVRKALAKIWTDKNETAVRLRGRIERILNWATVSGLRGGENPARWKGHLEHLLPNISREDRVVHHAALPYQQIGKFMESLRATEGVAARALEFLILTAARTGEVIGAKWAEIDETNRVWTVPPERMKAKKEHRVPLSEQAWTIIQDMKRRAAGDYVFPSRVQNKPLSNMAMLAVLKRMERTDLTAHGFRSTFRDWASEATPYPHQVQEMALAHTIENKVEAAYRRGDLFEKRTRMMADWAAYCGRKHDGTTNVIEMHKTEEAA